VVNNAVRRNEQRTQPETPTRDFSVRAGGRTLMASLVEAMLRQLHPNSSVHFDEVVDPSIEQGDVLVRDAVTGRELVVLAAPPSRQRVGKLLDAGIWSLLLVSATAEELRAAIGSICEGPAFVSPAIVRAMASDPQHDPSLQRITHREKDVLVLVARGLSNGEIAHSLSVSPNTVRSHLQSLSSKLGVTSRARLVARSQTLDIG